MRNKPIEDRDALWQTEKGGARPLLKKVVETGWRIAWGPNEN